MDFMLEVGRRCDKIYPLRDRIFRRILRRISAYEGGKGYGILFLKEWKERKEQRAKELEEKRNAFIKENMKYCDWLSAGTKVFLNELEAKGFKASWDLKYLHV